MLDIVGLDEAAFELHPGRQDLLEVGQGGLDTLGDLGDVGAVLLGDGDEDRALAVEAG